MYINCLAFNAEFATGHNEQVVQKSLTPASSESSQTLTFSSNLSAEELSQWLTSHQLVGADYHEDIDKLRGSN